MPKVVGFYTDEKKRVRPITARRIRPRFKRIKGKLDIVGVDVQRDVVKVKVPTEEGEVERELELMRHPSPYARVAKDEKAKKIKPEDVVFQTNSDDKSLIILTKDKVLYANRGQYGGYILREKPDAIEGAYFVEPSKKRMSLSELPPELKQKVNETLSKLPPEARERFEKDAYAEVIDYNYVEVQPKVKKETDRYVVVDFDPKAEGKKLNARALRLVVEFIGSRKHPLDIHGKHIAEELKLKYPENEIIQKNLYGRTLDDRSSALILKTVINTPENLT